MRTTLRNLLIASTVVGLALALAPVAAAHEGNNHGTIKVHDDEVVSPATRNDPKVSCDFWIEGFNMADDSGHLEFYLLQPGDDELVETANWTGTAEPDEDGFHFLAGPFNFTEGHYRVEAFNDQGHPGNVGHKAKSKVFKVEPCGQEEPTNCPPDVEATANSDGSITVTWGAVENATEYRVYRAVGDGDFVLVENTTALEYTDTATLVGETYSYRITAVVGGIESEDCPDVEVTAIPFFPGLLGATLAVLGGVGAVALIRRK